MNFHAPDSELHGVLSRQREIEQLQSDVDAQRATFPRVQADVADAEEIIAAQDLANSIGVDTLMFVFTHSRFKSVRYRPENYTELPIKYPNVTTSVTPHFFNKDLNLQNKIEPQVERPRNKDNLISISSLIGQLSKKLSRR